MDVSKQEAIADVFGKSVKRVRERREWSQSELARRMQEAGWPKYSQVAISRTEEGSRAVRLDEALGLARVLGVQLEDLMVVGSEELDLQESIEGYLNTGFIMEGYVRLTNEARGYLQSDVAMAEQVLETGDLDEAARERYERLIEKAKDALEGDLLYFVNRALIPYGSKFPYVKREPAARVAGLDRGVNDGDD